MPIVLFTDFGAGDLYLGQMKAVLGEHAPKVALLDALHQAPNFEVAPAAHLLAALAPRYPAGSVFVAVIDPGVGGERDAIVLEANGLVFVGPDNGLLSVLWQRATRRRGRRIVWRPKHLSDSFHGRDLFAPVAAALASKRLRRGWFAPMKAPRILLDAGDLAEIVYVDHYGNAMTGIRAQAIARATCVRVAGRSLKYARTFSDAGAGKPFWYENSLGLVEIAANHASAAQQLSLRVGTPVVLRPG